MQGGFPLSHTVLRSSSSIVLEAILSKALTLNKKTADSACYQAILIFPGYGLKLITVQKQNSFFNAKQCMYLISITSS